MSVAMETLRSQSKSLEALFFKEAFKEPFKEAVKEKLEARIGRRVQVKKTGRMNNERSGLSA